MRTLLILCLALSGCATKPEPMWDWCVDNPRRVMSCKEFKSKSVDQSSIRGFQNDVGVYTQRVRIAK